MFNIKFKGTMKMRTMMMTMLMLVCFTLSAGAKDIKKIVLKTTPEMHCGSCENRIKEALKYETGIKDIVTDLSDKTVTVSYDADKTDENKIIARLAKIQYTATPYNPTAQAKPVETAKKQAGSCCGSGGCKCSSKKTQTEEGTKSEATPTTPKKSCSCSSGKK